MTVASPHPKGPQPHLALPETLTTMPHPRASHLFWNPRRERREQRLSVRLSQVVPTWEESGAGAGTRRMEERRAARGERKHLERQPWLQSTAEAPKQKGKYLNSHVVNQWGNPHPLTEFPNSKQEESVLGKEATGGPSLSGLLPQHMRKDQELMSQEGSWLTDPILAQENPTGLGTHWFSRRHDSTKEGGLCFQRRVGLACGVQASEGATLLRLYLSY